MKIVLSRKGFDSSAGGGPSPILPDGAILSLPIPLATAPLSFADIRWRGESIVALVEAATRGRVRASDRAHLDPDLRADAAPRQPGWRPAFGQLGAAQTHLAAQGVGVRDLFLFFGWFRRAGGPDLHVLFGWLQIGEVLSVGTDLDGYRRRYPWLAGHPHLHAHAVPGNTIYLASDRLVLDGRDLGAGGGTFDRYHDGLRLTAPGASRSCWQLPGWFHPVAGTGLSYHGDPARWRDDGATCRLDSAKQGQEFVATAPAPLVADWVAGLLRGCQSGGVEPTVET